MARRVLGDELTGSEEEDEEGFQSPELTTNVTDYNFEYTSADNRLRSGRQKTTMTARKSTARSHRTTRHSASTSQQPRPSTARTAQPSTSSRRRKAQPFSLMDRERNFWKEVHALQMHTGTLVPRLPFGRLVREIIFSFSSEVRCVSVVALEGLQFATEMYLTQQLQDAYLLTIHRGRVTLMPKDMELLRLLREYI